VSRQPAWRGVKSTRCPVSTTDIVGSGG
jgi:hypothetical protein